MFWQAREEVEEQVEMGAVRIRDRKGTTLAEERNALWDITVGMIVSQLIAYFIQMSTAATLHSQQQEVTSAADAAKALQPLAGDAASALFAVGLIGAGLLAVPVLAASGAFATTQVFNWRSGLNQKFGDARQFYMLIAAVLGIGVAINFVGIDPFQALFLASLIFGLITPPLVVIVLILANNRELMGNAAPGKLLNTICVVTLLTNTAGAIGFLFTGGK
jgi:Mn2+/Fe2+ NRAMP family transporter